MPKHAETNNRPELVFALVGAAGTPIDQLSNELKDGLATFGYKSIPIRLSDLLANFRWKDQEGTSEFHRIRYLQDKGDAFRARLEDGAALARASIAEIRRIRASISGGSPDRPVRDHAYILRQLKHPDEVDLLRQVYGSSFHLVAGHATRELRVKELAERIARKASEIGKGSHYLGNANEIIEIDEKQDSDFGQNTRDTYPKADFFANLNGPTGHYDVRRFVDLLFGHPFHTPNPDEYAMYQASAASLRSSDENRQVGAVIVRLTSGVLDGKVKNVDVIAAGMNEVPRGGGGFYWGGDSPDARDQWLSCYMDQDRAAEIKKSALAELIERINKQGWLRKAIGAKPSSQLADELLPHLRRTQFLDIGEFSRPVHAEMAALIDSARRGVAVDGQTMYVTTFPCHNCAKHIIAAGLERVIYLEPYPKSRANILHGDEIALESRDGKPEFGKVVFLAFSGVAPHQYRQLFSMSERGAKKGKKPLKQWEADRHLLLPRYVLRNAPLLYLAEERQELEKLPTDVYHWDKGMLCPSAAASCSQSTC